MRPRYRVPWATVWRGATAQAALSLVATSAWRWGRTPVPSFTRGSAPAVAERPSPARRNGALARPGQHRRLPRRVWRYPASSPCHAYRTVQRPTDGHDADAERPPGTYRVKVARRPRRKCGTGCGDLRTQRFLPSMSGAGTLRTWLYRGNEGTFPRRATVTRRDAPPLGPTREGRRPRRIVAATDGNREHMFRLACMWDSGVSAPILSAAAAWTGGGSRTCLMTAVPGPESRSSGHPRQVP
jgi:hypothetical protein